MNAQQIGRQQAVNITAATFAAKYRSKREIFGFLSVEVKAYLCAYECLTIYFLKDLVAGKKKCKSLPVIDNPPLLDIKCDEIHYLFVPQYEALSISKILELA